MGKVRKHHTQGQNKLSSKFRQFHQGIATQPRTVPGTNQQCGRISEKIHAKCIEGIVEMRPEKARER